MKLNPIWNKIFKNEEVKHQIDQVYERYDSDIEGDLIALEWTSISAIAQIINIALIFDIISCIGYMIDDIFLNHFELFANGDYKYVIDQAMPFLNIILHIIEKNVRRHNKSVNSVFATIDKRQVESMPTGETMVWVTYLQAYKKHKKDKAREHEIEISILENDPCSLKTNKVDKRVRSRFERETLIRGYTLYERWETPEGKIFIKIW